MWGLLGPAQCRQVLGDRLIGLIVVAGYPFAWGVSSPVRGPPAIALSALPVRPGPGIGRLYGPWWCRRRWPGRPRGGGTVWRPGALSGPGHACCLGWAHIPAGWLRSFPARPARGDPGVAAAPAPDNDQGSQHDQRTPQRHVGEQHFAHWPAPWHAVPPGPVPAQSCHYQANRVVPGPGSDRIGCARGGSSRGLRVLRVFGTC